MRGFPVIIGTLISIILFQGGLKTNWVQATSLESDPLSAAGKTTTLASGTISQEVRDQMDTLKSGEMLTVIVTLAGQTDANPVLPTTPSKKASRHIQRLQEHARSSQANLLQELRERKSDGLVGDITPFWVFNGLAVTASPEVIEELGRRADVVRIDPNRIFYAPALPSETADQQSNIEVIHAPALWEMGFKGQGVVVANMDTGVFGDHPDLTASWRGGNNSWYDPSGDHPDFPFDRDGHGTWTMGVMVGGDSSGQTLGVAPEAQWIAVRIFDDDGLATSVRIHQGFQWLLDPDGDPNTNDAPHVVNNSWAFQSTGCFLDFQADILALRAAGILPIFAAGNAGPRQSTGLSPANNKGAFSVGAIDVSGNIHISSSRGPSNCGEENTIFPSLVAPGVSILTTGLFNGYSSSSGTSLAAPHVAGALALLLSAYPDLSVEEQESVLLDSAFDLGVSGPDNDYGYGKLDVLDAYRKLAGEPVPPAQPSSNDGTIYLPLMSRQFR